MNNDALNGGGLLRYRVDLPRGFALDALVEANAYDRGLAGTVDNPTPDARESGFNSAFAARLTKRFDSGGQLETLAWGRANRTLLTGGDFGNLFQADSGAGAEAVYTHLLGRRHGLTVLVSGGAEWLAEPMGPQPSWGLFSVMAQDELLLFDGAVSISGSLRVDQSGPFTGFSPKLGALWLLPKGFEIKANIGQSHRPPSFVELYVTQGTLLPNPTLRPENGLYADGAIAWRAQKFFAQVGGFYGLYTDLISYEYYPPLLARPYNFDSARVSGLEVEGRADPVSWLSLSATYTYLSTQNLKDDPRYYLHALPYRPAHKVQARLVVGPRWLYARGEVLYQSQQFVNRTQTLALPERALVSVGASLELMRAPQLLLSFEVKNLLDVQAADLDGYLLPSFAPRAPHFGLHVGRGV